MAQAGDIYTFTALFLDGLNNAIVVADPSIEIFAFDTEGVKVELVAAGTAMQSIEDEVGRYYYTYPISVDYGYAPTIFALMRGTHQESGFPILIEEQLHIIQAGGGSSSGQGMISRFVKGG